MKGDCVLATVLFGLSAWFLIQRGLLYMVAWLVLIYLFARNSELSHTVSVLVGVLGIYLISLITKKSLENFENEEKKNEPEGATEKTEPHVDVGTTILHAYRNLTPEQIGGMRRDTKELMALQKELMGSLAEMKPAIEQGAELLKTFTTFFGKPETE